MPFVLFSYYNLVLQAGMEDFLLSLPENGITGIIIPDLPFEENDAVQQAAQRAGIHLIPLVAPTSQERIQQIVSRASGFVYCVSSLGVTGMRTDFDREVDEFLQTVRAAATVPIAVGFGISSAEHVARFSRICNGVIVGSAIVRQVEENLPRLSGSPQERAEGLAAVHRFVSTLKSGTKSGA